MVMMTAKEMFKKLGYEFIECKESIRYLIDSDSDPDGDYKAIEFWLNEHTFLLSIIMKLKKLQWLNTKPFNNN